MRRFGFTLCVTCAAFLVVCASFAPVLSVPQTVTAAEPLKVTVCQLQNNPSAYDHKLVEVEAFVSQGFENFTLFDPSCYIYPEVWLEYGGKVNSGTIYFGPGASAREREKPLEVQGIPIPLVDDELFRKFDEKIHRSIFHGNGAVTHARLIGTYFAGRPDAETKDHAWGGFGHFGCCTLLTIQQVKAADLSGHPGMDELGVPWPLIKGFHPNSDYYYNLVPEDASSFVLDAQKKADEGDRPWAIDDPKRVALELISSDMKGKTVDPSRLKEASHREGFMEYTMDIPEWNLKYEVEVSRPAWLSFYARDPKRVAWVVLGGTARRLNEKKPMTRPK